MITIDGIPAHPLFSHAVVVLLPLAMLGGFAMAARASWRRRFGSAVLAVTAAGVAVVPFTQTTGEQLQDVLPPNPAIEAHADMGDDLLPFAIAFLVAMVLLYVAGRLADRERDAATASAPDSGTAVTRTWRRTVIVAAALVILTGIATTVEIIRIGHTGASAVWKGVGP